MPIKMNFSKAAIDAVPIPTDERERYYDTKIRGLMLRVSPRGAKVFYHLRKVDGQTRLTKIGPYPDMTIEQARKKAEEWNVQLAQGEDPRVQKRAKREEPTLRELFTWFLEHHAKLRTKHWKKTEWQFNRYFVALAPLKLSAITKVVVREWHSSTGSVSGIYAANRALALLSSMWNRGIHNDLTKLPNPCQAIEPFKEKSRSRRLGTEEMKRFIAAVEAEPSDTIRDWVWVSLLTAQRRGNVISMRFDDVDLQCRRWTIPETKNGETHIVPLHPHVLEIIKRRRVEYPESEWVFPGRSDGKGGHLCQPQHGWNRILDRAGIKDLHIHDLRRTFASYMADMGASLPMIGSALAHRDTATTAVYARIALNPVEDAMNLAGDAILKQAQGAKERQLRG